LYVASGDPKPARCLSQSLSQVTFSGSRSSEDIDITCMTDILTTGKLQYYLFIQLAFDIVIDVFYTGFRVLELGLAQQTMYAISLSLTLFSVYKKPQSLFKAHFFKSR
jgi:hypothetical protein